MRRNPALLGGLLLPSIILATAAASVIEVPSDYSTIQSAIDAAADGDMIVVAPGTYFENIDFLGKAVTLRSSHGPGVTKIAGSDPVDLDHGSVVTFRNGEGSDSVLEGFTLTKGTGNRRGSLYYGGGVYCEDASPRITDTRIIANRAGKYPSLGIGGAMFCIRSSPVITDCVISKAFAIQELAGIVCYRSSLKIRNSVISWVRSGISSGAFAIYCLESNLTLSSTTIRNNLLGVYCIDCEQVVAIDNLVTRNTGGMIFSGCNVVISGNKVIDNYGGYNFAIGIGCSHGTGCIDGNEIARNSNHTRGAGLGVSGSSVTVTNNLVYGNTSPVGAGIYCSGGSPVFTNNTIVGNTASHRGGGISCDTGATPEFTNCILWGNQAPTNPQIFVSAAANVTLRHCDIEGGGFGETNIDADPMLVAASRGDLHLGIGSPCIDTGTNDAPGLPGFDFEGERRIEDGDLDGEARVDIGADEFHFAVAVRFGTADSAEDALADVLSVDASPGDRKHGITMPIRKIVSLTMKAPLVGPDRTPFALHPRLGNPGL